MADDSVAGWYTDPTGLHQKRLWDGGWTGRVMDDGREGADPFPGGSSPPPVVADAGRRRRAWRLAELYGAVAGTAMTSAWIAPLVAGFVTASVFFGWRPFSLSSPVGAGLAAGLLAWLLAAIVLAPVVARPQWQSGSWEQASMRLAELEARLDDRRRTGGAAAGIDEAQAAVASLGPDFMRPGARWATYMGYIAMWQGIHGAEEALILSLDQTELWQAVQKARLRLDGATQAISARLTAIVADIARFLTAGLADGDASSAGAGSSGAAPPPDLGLPPVRSLDDARGRLREVTSAINTFRDQQYAGLVRLRNQTLAAMFLTELSAYVLLSLAVSYGIGTDVMATALLLFLVAATVGFLARLLTLTTVNTAVDDYGLGFARLLIVPVVSGLAGLGGCC